MRNFSIIVFCLILAVAGLSYGYDQPCFIENRGQWATDVLFKLNSAGQDVVVCRDTIYIYHKSSLRSNGKSEITIDSIVKLSVCNFKVSEVFHSNPNPQYYNYFHGNDKSLWKSNAKAYNQLLAYDFDRKEYLSIDYRSAKLILTFHLNPLLSIAQPRIVMSKALNSDTIAKSIASSKIITDTISCSDFSKTLSSLFRVNFDYLYNSDASAYFSQPPTGSSNIGNKVESNENKVESIITSPILQASTYIGGTNYDGAESIAVDSLGYIYVCGYTSSVDFPTTPGVFSRSLNLNEKVYSDVFVSKFSPDGSSLIFSTYFGGTTDDIAKALSLDRYGNICFTGYTVSDTSFPVTENSFSTTPNGAYDAFMVKLSHDGRSLVYSTFLGGSKDDYAVALKLDSLGAAFVAGYTSSPDYPMAQKSYQRTLAGKMDAFISKISPDGTTLESSTFLGGYNDDFAQSITFNSANEIVVAGSTRSANFPITSGAFQKVLKDTCTSEKCSDGFVAILQRDLSGLIASSYFGGSNLDIVYSVCVDRNDNILLAGVTESMDFPVRNSYDTSYNSRLIAMYAGDGFFAKLKRNADSLYFSSYFGGKGTDKIYAISLDSLENIVVAGVTSSDDFPVTSCALNRHGIDSANINDGFVSQFSQDSKKLLFSTAIGGKRNDVVRSLVVPKNNNSPGNYYINNYYVCGVTQSSDFPVSPTAYCTTYNDSLKSDGFVAVIKPLKFELPKLNDIYICKGDNIQIGEEVPCGYGKITYFWGPDVGLSDRSLARPMARPASSITYCVIVADEARDTIIDSLRVVVETKPEAAVTGPGIVIVGSIYSYRASDCVDCSFSWSVEGGEVASGQGTTDIKIRWLNADNRSIRLIETRKAGCSDTVDYQIMSDTTFKPAIFFATPIPICEGDTLILDGSSDWSKYSWSNGAVTRYDTIFFNGDYVLQATDAMGHSGISDTLKVRMNPIPSKPLLVLLNPTTLSCVTSALRGQWYYNGMAIESATEHTLTLTKSGHYFIRVYSDHGCMNSSDIYDYEVNSIEDPGNDDIYSLYPNPVTDLLFVEIANDNYENVEINIKSICGESVYHCDLTSKEKLFTKKIDASRMSSGMYFVCIRIGNKQYFEKIVVR